MKKYIKTREEFLKENNNTLPLSIDLDAELEMLKSIQTEQELVKKELLKTVYNTGDKSQDRFDVVHSKENEKFMNDAEKIETIIKNKLLPIMMDYINNGDYEGANWFITKSLKNEAEFVKLMLFRSILIHQKQNEK